ncbi:MAG: 4Fe-4S binding protein, partial [Oscillospiraceae bacterium]|nr:4Fe-4S binding protein [Oscillospiraceae bacterium]
MPFQKTTKEELEAFKHLRPSHVTTPENPRENILKLGHKITDRIVLKIKPDDPEYYGLNVMADDEVADQLLKMKVRKHYTVEQVAKMAKISVNEADRICMKACHAGVLEYWMEEGEKTYAIPPFVVGSGEWSSIHRDRLEREPERAYFFDRDTVLPLLPMAKMVPPGGGGIGMHVIPVEKEVRRNEGAVPYEMISHWLDKYDGKFAAMPCVCRQSTEYLGEGCGDDVEDWCVGMGDLSEYLVETGKGRWITREEAEHILKRAEEQGFVHQVSNMDGPNKIFVICNCQINTCKALRTSQMFNTPNLSRSAYTAHVDKEKCVACGQCVDICPAGAAKLGQKLCDRSGQEVSYPRHDLPDDRPWGEDRWDLHYRNNNRLNCHETGTAPCKTACPAHISIQGYLKKASEGKYQE